MVSYGTLAEKNPIWLIHNSPHRKELGSQIIIAGCLLGLEPIYPAGYFDLLNIIPNNV